MDWESKNSLLFIRLLHELKRNYRAPKRLVFILDNYRIHKSHIAWRWLANNPKVTLLFNLPTIRGSTESNGCSECFTTR